MRALIAVLALDRIPGTFLVEGLLGAGGMHAIRRRRLIAGRRLGQRLPRRLLLKLLGLVLVALEHAGEAAVVAKVGRHQRIGVAVARLRGIGGLGLPGRSLTRGVHFARRERTGRIVGDHSGVAGVLLVLLAL